MIRPSELKKIIVENENLPSKIVLVTSGGDAPGMCPAIASIAREAAKYNIDVYGVVGGFRGLLGDSLKLIPITLETELDIANASGTFLCTARCKEWVTDPKKGYDAAPLHRKAAQKLREAGIDALIVIGGDGSFKGGRVLYEDGGIPFIGIPGTIDNDLGYTSQTLGFDTAVNQCVDAVRSIRSTSRGHSRPHIVQVMGRNCGDIAVATAKATGAEMLIVPEKHGWSIDFYAERLFDLIHNCGNKRATLILSEHSIEYDSKNDIEHMIMFDWVSFLNGYEVKAVQGEELTAERLAQILRYKGLELEAKERGVAVKDLPYEVADDYEVRATVIGYTQRGNVPTASDSIFACDAGQLAVDLLCAGYTNQVIGIMDGKIGFMDMEQALAISSQFDEETFDSINNAKQPRQ